MKLSFILIDIGHAKPTGMRFIITTQLSVSMPSDPYQGRSH
jgi:hypothetical protein